MSRSLKTIGLIGGVSWQSTVEYYKIINTYISKELGGAHSAKILLDSLDFDPIMRMAHDGKWRHIEPILLDSIHRLEVAGVNYFLICANTLHKLLPSLLNKTRIPCISIIDVTANDIKEKGLTKVGLLGTRSTMEDEFFVKGLKDQDINCLVPEEKDRAEVHRVIFEELVKGEIKEDSRSAYTHIIERLVERGAQAIILGCTEIPLLMKQEDATVPLIDTTTLHALAAAKQACG